VVEAVTIIRDEQPGDAPGIRSLLEAAFPSSLEADCVDRLRASCPGHLSLVALEAGRLVGHILFTPVVIEAGVEPINGLGLAPMAVLPQCQRRGVGWALARAGIERLRQAGCPFIVVVGHPEYYPRFGFVPASRHGVRCQWDQVPDEAFMILVLDSAAPNLAGTARYRPEFDELE
jgi:putative acetyltransferase